MPRRSAEPRPGYSASRRPARDCLHAHLCGSPAAGLCPWARRPLPDGVNFALLCRHGTGRLPGRSTRSTATSRSPRSPCDPRTQPHRRSLARPRRAACRRRSATAGASTARRARATASTRPSSCSTPPPPRSPTARVWGESVRADSPRTHAAAASSSAARYDWQRGRAAADAAGRHHHLRTARPRLHLPSVVAASPSPAPSPA